MLLENARVATKTRRGECLYAYTQFQSRRSYRIAPCLDTYCSIFRFMTVIAQKQNIFVTWSLMWNSRCLFCTEHG
ncbi:Uncharacterized protein APZ42_029960 [Daphnia magna]|uniref:Uncharacterized protein n=1 Tax=Daphnia magna TaxID=35525 RepID=A0A164P6L8_9CRUS|nr:Uncharacterized protein APZ42_029960 [Daphnia magna]